MGSDDTLQPLPMLRDVSAPELLNDLVCSCKARACGDTCVCFRNGQTCTQAYDCKAQLPDDDVNDWCTNAFTLITSVESDELPIDELEL